MNSNSDPDAALADAPTTTPTQRLRKRRMALGFMLGLAAAAGTLWYVGASSPGYAAAAGQAGSAGHALPVVAVPARKGNFDVYLPALGTVTPLNAAVVRSKVDGELMSIAFKEGQTVKEGDLLAQIDPRPFEAQLALAAGQLARDQAMLDNAQTYLERYRALLAQDSISVQQVDTQESLVRQYQAAVQIDQGGVDNAKLQLAFATIVAPISGRVGLRQINPGNIVRAAESSGIVTITQLQPISVLFQIPEDALPRVMKRLRGGARIAVDAYDRAQKEKLGRGRLLAADNQIDPATGTIKLRAEFPNADGTLFPNQFVNVKMLVETRAKAILVPTAALQRGAAGTFVYVVKDDGTVGVTPVKTGPAQGDITVIEEGLSAGAMVVIDGADRLREGAKVELIGSNPAGAAGQPNNPHTHPQQPVAQGAPPVAGKH